MEANKTRDLGRLCQRALKPENDLVGSGLHVKKIRLARELRIDLRNEISRDTVHTVYVRKAEDQIHCSGGLRGVGIIWEVGMTKLE